MVKIGIITPILIHDLKNYMNCMEVLEYVKKCYADFIEGRGFLKSDIVLVSNGHPWINHIPISLFLEEPDNYMGIELCMATELNPKERKFLNTHEGRVFNNLYLQYKDISGIDGLDNIAQIVQTRKPNRKQIIKRGYKQANTMMVRNCDYVLFFGLTEPLESSGSKEVELWNKILCNKIFFSITDFIKK